MTSEFCRQFKLSIKHERCSHTMFQYIFIWKPGFLIRSKWMYNDIKKWVAALECVHVCLDTLDSVSFHHLLLVGYHRTQVLKTLYSELSPYKDYSLVVCGHSLGAGCASIVSLYSHPDPCLLLIMLASHTYVAWTLIIHRSYHLCFGHHFHRCDVSHMRWVKPYQWLGRVYSNHSLILCCDVAARLCIW